MSAVSRHTVVWLVRHPQTDWNLERRYQGRTDRTLTPFGQQIGAALCRRLRPLPFDAVVSSGLARTDTVARRLADQHAAPLIIDPRWREVDHGDWEGLRYADVMQHYGAQAYDRWGDPWNSRVHGGDSMSDLWERIHTAWDALLAAHDGEHLAVVTHGTPIQLVLCSALGVPFERHWQFRIDLGSVTALDLYPSGAILRAVNDVPLLPAKHHKQAQTSED